ncbi:pentatricopeptide repeat-containing protein, partial [Tanacetum coccineum]
MSIRDAVSWTAVIDGFIDNGRALEGLRYFRDMEMEGFVANDVTIVSVLRACAETGAFSIGVKLDKLVKLRGNKIKKNVVTTLIDMYSKCGCIDSARRVFSETVDKDVYVWTAMISGLASHGRCKEATELFERMESDGLRPDEKTMTAVLSACRNMGWVNEGRLDDAQKFIKSMPIEPDAVMLRSLIWGYKVHGDTERLEDLIEHIEGEKIDSCDDCGTYELL